MAYTYKYPRPAVTADCVVITREVEPKVLLIQRGDQPFKGGWAFPGGFMNMDETTEQCAVRELEEETGLRLSKIQQIGAYSKVDRDPRGRTITVAYLAIVDEPVAVTGHADGIIEWCAATGAVGFPVQVLGLGCRLVVVVPSGVASIEDKLFLIGELLLHLANSLQGFVHAYKGLLSDNFHRTALIDNNQVVNSLGLNFIRFHNRNFLNGEYFNSRRLLSL